MYLVEAASAPPSFIQVTKLLFLLRYEHLLRARAPESAAYQFLPYLHGPYSFALAHELEGLLAVGELRQDEKGGLVRPPELGTVKLASDLKRVIEGLLHSFGGLRKDELVRSVYERYPWFTLNAKDLRCRKVKPPTSVPGIYLAGYEGLQVDGFLNLLLESGIRRLIDIRANPVSRKFGFHGSTLRRLCNKLAIGYEHVPALGIASAWRTRLDPSRRDGYDDLFRRYESEVLPIRKREIRQVAEMMRAEPAVLVCQEADPCKCHRLRVGRAVARLTGLPLKDLR